MADPFKQLPFAEAVTAAINQARQPGSLSGRGLDPDEAATIMSRARGANGFNQDVFNKIARANGMTGQISAALNPLPLLPEERIANRVGALDAAFLDKNLKPVRPEAIRDPGVRFALASVDQDARALLGNGGMVTNDAVRRVLSPRFREAISQLDTLAGHLDQAAGLERATSGDRQLLQNHAQSLRGRSLELMTMLSGWTPGG